MESHAVTSMVSFNGFLLQAAVDFFSGILAVARLNIAQMYSLKIHRITLLNFIFMVPD